MLVPLHYLGYRFGLLAATTQTTQRERTCLAGHARGRALLAEVGVWHGVTTCVLRQVMAPSGMLLAIDPYPRGRLAVSFAKWIAHREVDRVQNGRVVWWETTGAAAGREWAARGEPHVEFLFVDGDHSFEGLRADWEAWRTQIAPSGIVALHDSRSTPARPIDGAGSVQYTNEVIRRDPLYAVVDEVESLTVVRRVADRA